MRICVVDPSLFTLAYDRHLCAGLHEAGATVTLCGRALREGETLGDDGYRFAPRCYRWTERGGRAPAHALRAWAKALEHVVASRPLARWLDAEFDVLHFQWSPLPLADHRCWRWLARRRTVVFTVHDTTPFLGRPTSRGQQLGWRRLLDAAHGLVVHTQESRRALERLGIAPERIAVIPHGPLHPAGAGRARANDAARSQGDDGRRTLLVFGEIKPYKGIDVLLRATARLPRALADGWRLVIAGRPRCELTELRALAQASRVPVEWRTGFVPDDEVGPLFSGADLAVFPYRQIDASGALMLALPFAVPVIASRVGSFREVIEDGVTGLLVPPGDVEALAAALERAMSDAALRERMRTNLRVRADRAESWSAIARAHLAFYRRWCGEAGEVARVHVADDAAAEEPAEAALLPRRSRLEEAGA